MALINRVLARVHDSFQFERRQMFKGEIYTFLLLSSSQLLLTLEHAAAGIARVRTFYCVRDVAATCLKLVKTSGPRGHERFVSPSFKGHDRDVRVQTWSWSWEAWMVGVLCSGKLEKRDEREEEFKVKLIFEDEPI